MGEATNETNYLRRGLGVVVGCAPLGLLLASVVYAVIYGERPSTVGLVVELAALLGFGSMRVAVLGVIAFAADTGGSIWFVIATWRDSSLWDAPTTRRRP